MTETTTATITPATVEQELKLTTVRAKRLKLTHQHQNRISHILLKKPKWQTTVETNTPATTAKINSHRREGGGASEPNRNHS
jgi:hypothetical protein